MKKVFSLILVLALLLGMTALAEEETPSYVFEPSLSEAMDKTATDWFSTSSNRALLTLLLTLDVGNSDVGKELGLDGDFLAEYITNGTYVGRSESILMVSGYVGNKVYTMLYMPVLGAASLTYYETSSPSALLIELALGQVCPDGVQANTLSEIVEWAQVLNDLLESGN